MVVKSEAVSLEWMNREGVETNRQIIEIGSAKRDPLDFTLFHIQLDFVKAEKPFTVVVQRIDIIGKKVFFLNELVKSDQGSSQLSTTIKVPRDPFVHMNICVYHTLITNGLVKEGEIGYSNVILTNSKAGYLPLKLWSRLFENEDETGGEVVQSVPCRDEELDIFAEGVPLLKKGGTKKKRGCTIS